MAQKIEGNHVVGYDPGGLTTRSEVKALQQSLNAQGAGLKEDGIYGPKTDAALKAASAAAAAAAANAASEDAPVRFSYAPISYSGMGEEQMRAGAEAEANMAYEARIREIEEYIIAARNRQNDELLRRGMGRSSQLLEILANLEETAGTQKGIAQQERVYNAAKLYAQMAAEENARRAEVDMFNRQQDMQAQKLNYDYEKDMYERAQAEAEAAMAASTSSAGKANKSSAANKTNSFSVPRLVTPATALSKSGFAIR